MNDWGIRSFIVVVASLFLCLMGLQYIACPPLGELFRPIVGFFFLSFMPGFILLRILRIHGLSNIESLGYALGLSIIVIMFTGLALNTALPFLHYARPISLVPIDLAIGAVTIVLCSIAYIVDGNYAAPGYLELKDLLSPQTLFLVSLPLMTVLATYLVNQFQSSTALMLILLLLCAIVVLAGSRLLNPELYPLAILVIAVCLLLHNSLISQYILGWDINEEYYWANLVLITGHWSPASDANVDGMLSIVMMAPIYTQVLGMSLTWTFKIVYPLLFTALPLVLYNIFERQTKKWIAFFACFFFLSFFAFYTDMLMLARQQIAEVFLGLLLLLLVQKSFGRTRIVLLSGVFGMGLIVAHYGLSYLYLVLFPLTWCLLFVLGLPAVQGLAARAPRGIGDLVRHFSGRRSLSLAFVCAYCGLLGLWYVVLAPQLLETISFIISKIWQGIQDEFFNTDSLEGMQIIVSTTPGVIHELAKYFHLASVFFITIGILYTLFCLKLWKFEKEYILLGVMNFLICVACITVPFFAKSLNTSRIYQISLIVLAPFCVIGAITCLYPLARILKATNAELFVRASLCIIALFLIILFLFNSGFIYEALGDTSARSISLSQETVQKNMDKASINEFYASYHPPQEIAGVLWLSGSRNDRYPVFADYVRCLSITRSYGSIPRENLRDLATVEETSPDSGARYIYLGYPNVRYGIMYGPEQRYWDISQLNPVMNSSDKIYDNAGSAVYLFMPVT